MPWGATEEPDTLFEMPESIAPPVPSSGRHTPAAEFGNWRTYLFFSGSGVVQLAPRSPRRKRLLIGVFASQAAQPVIDGIIVGSRDFINQSNSGGVFNPLLAAYVGGGYLPIGTTFRWECQQALWATYATLSTNNILVTVSDEMYAGGE